MAWVYILRCSDDSYYVGSTRDLPRRLAQHSAGLGAEYTKRRLPVELVFCEEFAHVNEAFALEKRIQGWSRAKREALIDRRFELLPELAKKRRPRATLDLDTRRASGTALLDQRDEETAR